MIETKISIKNLKIQSFIIISSINPQHMSVTLTHSITGANRRALMSVRKHVAARTGASDRTARQLNIANKGHLNQDIFNFCTVNPQLYFKGG